MALRLRRYLADEDRRPAKPLIADVPVSLREALRFSRRQPSQDGFRYHAWLAKGTPDSNFPSGRGAMSCTP